MEKVMSIFGSEVFNDEAMRQKLPKDVYLKLKSTIEEGKPLDNHIAGAVANAMKDWAVEKGATHYTHWFQPMTGITAEKHESFISPVGNSSIIMEFSGKELVQGEPDASSFPSGGMRSTFEARGYTARDPTSYAFIKDGVLCIPTIFLSYSGASLDKKTPLLKSMAELNKQALRVLNLFGSKAKRVVPTVGAEQEYFLVKEDVYRQRKDLILTGRTLFGSPMAKGQEMNDHYFTSLDPSVQDFMNDLDNRLWKLGIYAKTEHKEVAPGQYELACIYVNANLATDQNQIVMEMMQKVAKQHHYVCLLHEKPFEGINGSGKHNNWSLMTDTGENLLEPGDTPEENAQFLVFFLAVVAAVDEYQDLLRISVASASNDHRLGANEAPPAIVSMFIGEDLYTVLEGLKSGKKVHGKNHSYLKVGTDVLPEFKQDTTDRNRTSPFAFTGNKFEFRMLGSSFSISCPNQILDVIVSDQLQQIADKLENAKDFTLELNKLTQDLINEHSRIIFNGNGYDEKWIKEAEKRGLVNYATSAQAIPHYLDQKNVELFKRHNIFTQEEMTSRMETLLDNYSKTIDIEAKTLKELTEKEILPGVLAYQKELGQLIKLKKDYLDPHAEIVILKEIDELTVKTYQAVKELEDAIHHNQDKDEILSAKYHCEVILPKMEALRKPLDILETKVPKSFWKLPTYEDLLF